MILTGKSAVPGVTLGSIYVYNKKFIIPAEGFISEHEKQSQFDRYLLVKEQAINELEVLKTSLMQKLDVTKAEIFKVHQEIVDDIVVNEEISARILNDLWAGDWAIYQAYETFLGVLRQTEAPLISERTEDFEDVRARLLRLWYGEKNEGIPSLSDPVIIAAHDLKPSDTANLNKEKTLAILTETGGVTSHTAIIAKSYGIPCIMGIENLLSYVKQGQQAAVNATDGKVILDPTEDVKLDIDKKSADLNRDREYAETFREKECFTSCGTKIDIGINISNAENEASIKKAQYSDMAGLFRTEFLFLGRDTLPTEEEQFICYKNMLENFGKKPVVLRTLDIGGDKQLPHLEIKPEANPFLGIRGIRFCFNYPNVFKTQIRAALRASVYGNLWLMLPMITSLDCFRNAKSQIAEIKAELEQEGHSCVDIKIGVMIEVPSAALIAGHIAKEADFASIGTNDLCQYLCAADRMNSEVNAYYQSYHPAMFLLIKNVAEAFAEEGKTLSICGELGSAPYAVPLLIGLGLRKFSVGDASIAEIKRVIASVTIEKTKQIAETVLRLSTADEIQEYLTSASS